MLDHPSGAGHRKRSYDLDQMAGGGSAMTQSPAAETSPYPYHLCSAEPSDTVKVLQIITYLVVIVTCVAILYAMFRGYLFLEDLKTAIKQLADSWGGSNLLGE